MPIAPDPAGRPEAAAPPTSVRPDLTAQLMAATGLDEAILTRLVHQFYARVRADDLIGWIFEQHVDDWPAHLDRMVAFWSSVALMTGRYHGAPMPAHMDLPVTWTEFERWLAIWTRTAEEVCPPEGAALVIDRARRVARSLHAAVEARQGRDLSRLL